MFYPWSSDRTLLGRSGGQEFDTVVLRESVMIIYPIYLVVTVGEVSTDTRLGRWSDMRSYWADAGCDPDV